MTAMRKLKADVTTTTEVSTTTTTDVARVGGHVVRVFAAVHCPHCLRGRLHASSVRDVGESEFAWTCSSCHRDIFAITRA